MPDQPQDRDRDGGKVGSDPDAAGKGVGGDRDFGIPARTSLVRETSASDVPGTGQIRGRPAGSAMGRTGASGTRDTGVGTTGGGPGHAAGGDLDPDFVGIAGEGGIAQSAAGGAVGADATDGTTDDFSGKVPDSTTAAIVEPASGRNALPKGAVGGDKRVAGHTHGIGDAHNERQGASENFYDPQDTK